MADEKWQKVKEILAAALQQKPEERLDYINEACGDDPTLRAEVESLFSSLDSSEDFLEKPAVAGLADLIQTEIPVLEMGKRFGHYEIIRKIGAGGMGEVYLASDKKLDRLVALKILNEKFSRDESNLHRFIREAKAASALDHQNILVIHEINEADNVHYIVSEYVKGRTLRDRLKDKTLKLSEILDISIQIASALSAAHEARLIHRDIKPENIMIRRDGFVKVLDFGLAKLIEQKNKSFLELAESIITQNQTAKGVIMGTVNYMSPEQAKGERVDERTDVFSLGAVLYEMLVGRTPFQGDSVSETFANLIKSEPQPFSQFARNVPHKLEQIVLKMLSKEREERYQTMESAHLDLKDLRENLSFEEKLERSASPDSNATTLLSATTGDANLQTAQTQNSVSTFIKRRKFTAALMGLVLLVVLAGIGYGSYILLKQSQAKPQKELKMTLVTNSGKANISVISPDGKYIAYSFFVGEKQSLRVRHTETASEIEVAPPSTYIYGITFSPDNNYIYYVKADDKTPGTRILYRVPVLGGVSEKLLYDIDSAVSFSPDGKNIVFARLYPSGQNQVALIITTALGTDERRINVESDTVTTPAWSKDGKIIAYTLNKRVDDVSYQNIIGIRVEDESVIPISSKKWRWITQLEWLSDNSGLLMAADDIEDSSDKSQIWQISFPDGAPRRITNDTNDYWKVSLTSDSQMLVTTKFDVISSTWVAPTGTKNARQITSGKNDGAFGFDWTSDGKIVFTTIGKLPGEFWIMEADGSGRKQLAGAGIYPEVTADGTYIVFSSINASPPGLWKMNIESGEITRLITHPITSYHLSPDGKWVVYSTDPDDSAWKLPIEGGEPILLVKKPFARPLCISPDGKLLAYYFEHSDQSDKIGIMPFEGGETIKVLDDPKEQSNFEWLPDSSALSYLTTENGISSLWCLPLDGSKPKQLTKFEFGPFVYFAWSRDGKNLALRRSEEISDVVLIRDFR